MKLLILLIALFLFPIALLAQNEDKDASVRSINEAVGHSYELTSEALRTHDVSYEYGSTYIAGTTTAVGHYFAIQVITDVTIDSLVDSGRDGDAIGGITLTAGKVIFGKDITRIKLSSGAVIAYKRP